MAINFKKKTLLDNIWISMDTFKKNLKHDPETGCINWTGVKHQQGYGFIHFIEDKTFKRKQTTTHRIAYRIANPNDPISPREFVVHTCGNMACCNPAHLVKGNHDTIQKHRDAWFKPRDTGGEVVRRAEKYYKYTTAEYCWMRNRPILQIQQRFGLSRREALKQRARVTEGHSAFYKWTKHFDDQGNLKNEYKHLYE